MTRSEVFEFTGAHPTEGAPVNDTWGIVNYAMQYNRSLWRACPGSRRFLLAFAAMDRLMFSHFNQDDDAEKCRVQIEAWRSYAEWLAGHIDPFIKKDAGQ